MSTDEEVYARMVAQRRLDCLVRIEEKLDLLLKRTPPDVYELIGEAGVPPCEKQTDDQEGGSHDQETTL